MTRKDLTGYSLSCRSEEALKAFNDGVLSYVSFRENGLPSIYKALELDDSIVLAHSFLAFALMLELKAPDDAKVAPHIEAIKAAVSSRGDQLTPREHAYVRAVLVYASGNLFKATEEFCTMLIDYPLDALAMRITFICYSVLGEFERMRDMFARSLVHWTEDMQLYPFILGFYGFSLEECNERELGEKSARRALALNKHNPFATHALAHVFEEVHEAASGVDFMTSTREDWRGAVFEGHLTWHLTLFYLDLGDMESLFHEFDEVLSEKAVSDNRLGLLDASSLLWRLDLLGIEVEEERWRKVTDALATHVGNHRSPWFDAHIMMGLAHGKVSENTARLILAQGMIKSLEEYSKSDNLPNCDLSKKVCLPVCNALLAFGEEKYDEVVQIMLPLRHNLIRLGGSWAQRQIFSLTLIQAAIKANNYSLALLLVAELKARKPKSKRLRQLLDEVKLKLNGQNQISS